MNTHAYAMSSKSTATFAPSHARNELGWMIGQTWNACKYCQWPTQQTRSPSFISRVFKPWRLFSIAWHTGKMTPSHSTPGRLLFTSPPCALSALCLTLGQLRFVTVAALWSHSFLYISLSPNRLALAFLASPLTSECVPEVSHMCAFQFRPPLLVARPPIRSSAPRNLCPVHPSRPTVSFPPSPLFFSPGYS